MALTVTAQVDARGFDVDLHLESEERLAVLGPNGAGKSTLLAVLAGTLRPDRGRAELDGEVLFDVDGRHGRWQPPHARRVALLAQDPLLFPNLTVMDNVAFGPRAARVSRSAARQTARRLLRDVGATELADRKPAQLSGGQAQRVAVARAVAADPKLLLLDEPLAALDVTASPMLRRVLRDVLADRSAIVVTHDLLDAVLLSSRVVVLDRGRIVESGPTADVLRHPTSTFTARLAGLNLIAGTAQSGGLRPEHGGPPVGGLARSPLTPGERATAVFTPTAVSVYLAEPHGSPRNVFPVTITELEPRGEQTRVRAATSTGESLTADLTTAAVGDLDLYPGRSAFYTVKATAVTIYPS
ncbi:MAG TPA: ATP-binding cassette domain-containing protein [Microlunatus sp.]|nr:ATP-binding cassette domain-containing protein [Microlunatus sp.]